MAVYTIITAADIADTVSRINLGNITALEPIAAGIENTNYHLFTDRGRYILTIFEKRTDPAALPFFIALMRHLAQHGLPCPDVLTPEALSVKGKAAIITTWLEGASPDDIDGMLCYQAGRLLAAMHLATMDVTMARDNTLPPSSWRQLVEAVGHKADILQAGLYDLLIGEIGKAEQFDATPLPQGVIHADLFPDNVFFKDLVLSGVIDFYFACKDTLVYDLMLTINAWCGSDTGLDMQKMAALKKGYESLRPLSPDEIAALPHFGKRAALRIIATRLYDWFQDTGDATVTKKDPLAHLRILENYLAWDKFRA